MNTYIGIDLGTSAVKLLLVSADGKILNGVSEEYPVLYPLPNHTEQNPCDWINAVMRGLKRLLEGQDKSAVKGISCGGQMHGLVALDGGGEVIRPCILWNDGRTGEETAYLNQVIGSNRLLACTGNIAFAGFTAPKLIWLKKNEPQNFSRIAKIMLPKDYVLYTLSGEFCTDFSDASGTLLLDVQHRRWSEEMCAVCGISAGQLPKLYESYEVVGTLKKELAATFGLSAGVKIIAGAGDNAAAAIGTGAVREGDCNISLGTSGTVFIPSRGYPVEGDGILHKFCHANGGWHLMGCILSAASARKWWLEDILESCDYAGDERAAEGCKGGVYFLPYLSGERCPHNDVNARGAFVGLSAQTTRGEMSRAVMEGVIFALKDCLSYAAVKPAAATVCGGGAKSGLWKRLTADILGLPVKTPVTEQGPAYGAAILAMTGCGEYASVTEAADALVSYGEEYLPDVNGVKYYEQKFSTYKKLYPALKGIII